MTKDIENKRYRAPALDKGLDIIELLASQPRGMTRTEIVNALGKSHSEIYRMIERLIARNYLSRSIEGDRYALTMKLFHLGTLHPPVRRLVAHVQPLMDEFSRQSMQAVHLVVADMGHALVVARSSSRAAWEFRLRIGALLDFLETSSGQTLLAFQDVEQAEQLLRAVPEATGGIPDGLATEMRSIKEQGYRMGASRQLVGVTDISVPIQSAYGVTTGVLTCPFLPLVDTLPIDTEALRLEETLNLLRETAKQASAI